MRVFASVAVLGAAMAALAAQPPIDCGAIAAEQADFLAFRGQQFGPRDCPPAR